MRSKSTEPTNNITLDLDKEQIGEIKVHSQIINDLSSGIYSSPASCIKELINNSFDADATSVIIRMKPIEDTITIWDDGNGMNAKDFDENFAWISKSNKRKKGIYSKTGRPLIGKIGIGFIAVNEICEVLEVTSSKRGEPFKFTSIIDFSKITESETSKGPDDDTYLKGEFVLTNEAEEKSEHYTSIKLIGLRDPVLVIFNDETYKAQVAKSKNRDFAKMSFKTMRDLLDHHSTRKAYSWENDSEYLQFVLDLASYIPVEYIEHGPIEGVDDKIIREITTLHRNFNFKVDFDGMYLKKPIYFAADKRKRTDYVSFKKKLLVDKRTKLELKLKGYFYIQNSLLIPRELNGIAIRIKNIPIAERFGFDSTFLRYPIHTDQIFRNWISGEVYVEEGLEDAMNIDRKSFRVTHPDYIALQNFLHEFMRETVFKRALKLYESGRDVREDTKKKTRKEDTLRILRTKNVTIKAKPRSKTGHAKRNKTAPVEIVSSNRKEVIIEVDTSSKSRYKKKDWEFLETVFIIFESAFKESKGNINRLRQIFYSQIEDWKAKDGN